VLVTVLQGGAYKIRLLYSSGCIAHQMPRWSSNCCKPYKNMLFDMGLVLHAQNSTGTHLNPSSHTCKTHSLI
jgi:hypothetical protein